MNDVATGRAPGPAPGALRHLLRAKRRTLTNYRRTEGGLKRALAIIVFGLAFWCGLYFGAHWFLGKVVEIEPIGVLMARRLLSLVLVFLFSILSFSSLIAAFSTYYLAEDLQLLMSKPIAPYALFGARFVENTLSASWMTLCFSLPFFLALGAVMHAPPGYWLALGVVLVGIAIIPSALATIASLMLTFPFSARRARQLLVFVGTALVAVAFVLLRDLEPERFLNPDERAPMLEALEPLTAADRPWLPSSWAAEALWSQLGPRVASATHPLGLLAAGSATSFFVAGWAFRAMHRRAFSRAQEGVDLREEIGERRRRGRSKSLDQLTAQRARKTGGPSFAAVMRAKDLRAWLRDTAQWSQGLLILALIAIYVVNFRYIRNVGDTGIISQTGLHFTNLALSGFVAMAVCARFGFPAISLEGRAFWLVLRSPHPLESVLAAKWRSMLWPLLSLINLLVLLTNVSLGSSATLTLTAAVVASIITATVLAMAIGLGARHPRFKIDNAAKIATGFGGVLFMVSGITVALATVIASAYPTLTLAYAIDGGHAPSARRVAYSIVLALLTVAGPWWIGRRSLLRGAASLRARGI